MRTMLRVEDLIINRRGRNILEGFDLSLRKGESVALMGSSGVGKTSILRALLGHGRQEWCSTRSLLFGDGTNPKVRMGYVPQGGGFFPWSKMLNNLQLAHRVNGASEDFCQRIEGAMQHLQLGPDLLDRYPDQISGGERQRFALIRSVLGNPEVFLLDEPLGSLDPGLRLHSQAFLQEVLSPEVAAIIVTHNIEEGLFLADRILILGDSPARILHSFEVRASRPRGRSFRDAENTLRLARKIRVAFTSTNHGGKTWPA